MLIHLIHSILSITCVFTDICSVTNHIWNLIPSEMIPLATHDIQFKCTEFIETHLPPLFAPCRWPKSAGGSSSPRS